MMCGARRRGNRERRQQQGGRGGKTTESKRRIEDQKKRMETLLCERTWKRERVMDDLGGRKRGRIIYYSKRSTKGECEKRDPCEGRDKIT